MLLALFGAVQQATPGFVGGDDGYYHVKMARLMRSDPTPEFTWLPLTILNAKDFADHHWLFHILLIPFTASGPFAMGGLVQGGKLAAAAFAAAALVASVPVMRRAGVQRPELWSVLMFASSSAFVYRLSMPRAQSVSLLWLFMTAYVLQDGRHWRLLAVGMTYVWLYNGFPLLPAVVAVYLIAVRVLEGRWLWRTAGFAMSGVVLGVVVNPFFPRNVVFLYHHLVAKLDRATIAVGSEWAPYTTAQLLENSAVALLAVVGGVVGLGWARRRMDVPSAFGLGLCILFGALLFVSRRFVEYFPAFAVLFCALACRPVLRTRRVARGERPEQAASALLRPPDVRLRPTALPTTVALVVLLVAVGVTMRQARAAVRGTPPPEHFAGASAWLAQNTPAGAIVFQSDWDDFPRLFFHNTHNRYVVGLDPTYLHIADPILYWQWVDITQGRGRDFGAAIRDDFGADYAVTDQRHRAFLARAAADPTMVEVYSDESSVLFKVIDID